MKPEIKAKIDELVKNRGRRALSDDETEQVAGGGNCLAGCTTHAEIDAFCDVVDEIINSFGKEVAIEWVLMCEIDPLAENAIRVDGANGLRQHWHVLLDADLSDPAQRYYDGSL